MVGSMESVVDECDLAAGLGSMVGWLVELTVDVRSALLVGYTEDWKGKTKTRPFRALSFRH